jgi:hypothetical protein
MTLRPRKTEGWSEEKERKLERERGTFDVEGQRREREREPFVVRDREEREGEREKRDNRGHDRALRNIHCERREKRREEEVVFILLRQKDRESLYNPP